MKLDALDASVAVELTRFWMPVASAMELAGEWTMASRVSKGAGSREMSRGSTMTMSPLVGRKARVEFIRGLMPSKTLLPADSMVRREFEPLLYCHVQSMGASILGRNVLDVISLHRCRW